MAGWDGTLPITALVIAFNEDRRLSDCLAALDPCSDVIVVDLGSTDRSVEVARRAGARLITRAWSPNVESVLPDVVHLTRNDWIVRLDPDEVFPFALWKDVVEILAARSDIAEVELPFQYHFLGRPLYSSMWGGAFYMKRVFHRHRVTFPGVVHRPTVPLEGYTTARVEARPENLVLHYWVDSLPQMIEKHRRYIALEGQAALDRGECASWGEIPGVAARSLRASLIQRNGWRGGWRGWFLSFLWAWYVTSCRIALLREARERSGAAAEKPAEG